MLYLKLKDIVVTTTFEGALHATLMPSISYAKYGQENGPFGPVTVELESQLRPDDASRFRLRWSKLI